MSKHRTCFGISFGNTSLCIAVQKDGKTDVVANDSGERTTPAVVNFSQNEICVGALSKNRLLRQPRATIPGVKRFLGSTDASLWDLSAHIPCEAHEGSLRFTVTYEKDDDELCERKVTTEELITYQLKKLHDIAQNQRNDDSYPCVISVPTSFSEELRKVVKTCAENAGFDVLRVINEPSAAALVYLNRKEPTIESPHILVYRLGGESSDVTILKYNGGIQQIICSERMISTGGQQWTVECAKYAAEEFKRKTKVSWDELSQRSKGKVLAAAEEAKHVLSTMESCVCSAESIHEGLDMNVQLTRARFEKSAQNHLLRAKQNILDVLGTAQITRDQVNMVVLSGGGCRMVSIQNMIASEFPSAEICKRIAPDEAVAVGSAIEADILYSRQVACDEKHLKRAIKLPTLSKNIDIQLRDGSAETILAKGTATPCKFEGPILLGDDEASVKILLLQEGLPLAKVVMADLNDNSDLTLSVEVLEDCTLRCQCVDKTTNRIESIIVE
ncbi:heat shock 70 kDa protein 14 [Galendromus occidentalis]|uniref:Heat shock 70 kDa protein 14 n=1 Tax=Galendromus occidentalis TaxID=34638 RepID=A0AAJ6QM04_9ACAR|nr:heat shock 70 kDa protein 14 [Galendromus occidentalis]